jgi:ABC-type glycerol-3-phosphate transport system substrate-binding protein
MILNPASRRAGRTSWAAVALVVAVLASAGCSATTSPTPTTLRVTLTDDWVTPPVLEAVRDFEGAHPSVRVIVDKAPIKGMLDMVRGSASPPDVVQSHAFSAAARGLAQPLDDLWAKYLKPDDFFPGALDDVTLNGHRFGVPLDTNALVLLYNADQFRAAGVPIPTAPMTFAHLAEIARTLTSADGGQRAIALGTSTWQTYGWVGANGGEYVRVGDDGRPQFLFDSPPVLGAVGFLAGLVAEGVAIPPTAPDLHSNDVFALFESGAATMYTSGSWDVAKLRKSHPEVDYRAAPMPVGVNGTQGSAMGGSSLFVPKGSTHRKLAFEFMTSLISDRYALRLAEEEGRLPVRSRVYQDQFFQNPVMQVVLEQLKTARPERIDSFPEAGTLLADALDQILREHRDPEAALREAQTKARALVGTS